MQRRLPRAAGGQVQRPAGGGKGGFPEGFAERGVGMDEPLQFRQLCPGSHGQGPLLDEVGGMGAQDMHPQDRLRFGIGDDLDNSLPSPWRKAFPLALKGNLPTLTAYPAARASSSVMPARASSGWVKMHTGTAFPEKEALPPAAFSAATIPWCMAVCARK